MSFRIELPVSDEALELWLDAMRKMDCHLRYVNRKASRARRRFHLDPPLRIVVSAKEAPR